MAGPARVHGARLAGRGLSRFRRDPAGLLALMLFLGVAGAAVFAPAIASHDPLEQDLNRRLLAPALQVGGSWTFPLGTDQLGRDILSRIIYAARVSLSISLLATLLSGGFGIAAGLIAGLREGWLGDLVLRLTDVQLAFPFLMLAIAIVTAAGPSYTALVVTLAIWGWVPFARIARAEVISIKHRDFVAAAQSVGAGHPRVLLRHVLPNAMPPLIVIWTFSFAQMVITESSLSYLGMGIQPPTPSWGNMLTDGRDTVGIAWWLATFPGLAIMGTVLAINVLGDILREVLDPHLS
jgi:peptide/nickel transport system permease protein